MASPEAKIRFLGKEFDPGKVALGGLFLMLAGAWASYAPCIAIPAILVGSGMMFYGTRRMEQQNQQAASK